MENLRPNGQRAKIAMMLIWTVLTIEIISILSDYLQYDLLPTVAKFLVKLPLTMTYAEKL